MTDLPPLPPFVFFPEGEAPPPETPKTAVEILRLPEEVLALLKKTGTVTVTGQALKAATDLAFLKILTEQGVVELRTAAPVPTGTAVVLEIKAPEMLHERPQALLRPLPSSPPPPPHLPLPTIQTASPPAPIAPLKPGDRVFLLPLPPIVPSPPPQANAGFLPTIPPVTLPGAPLRPKDGLSSRQESPGSEKNPAPLLSNRPSFFPVTPPAETLLDSLAPEIHATTRPLPPLETDFVEGKFPTPPPILDRTQAESPLQNPGTPPLKLDKNQIPQQLLALEDGILSSFAQNQELEKIDVLSRVGQRLTYLVEKIRRDEVQAEIVEIILPENPRFSEDRDSRRLKTDPSHSVASPPDFEERKAPEKSSSPFLIEARVELRLPSGESVLKTEDARFVLRSAAPLPEGARLVLSLPSPAAGIVQSGLTPPESSLYTWPALQEAVEVLKASDPDIARTLIQTLPSPAPQNLPPATLFFLAALRLGDVGKWLGDPALQALRKSGHDKTAERLSIEFEALSAQSRTPLPGGWTQLPIPLFHDDTLSQIRFFVRAQNDGEDGASGKDERSARTTRFLINFRLTKMGEMQIDGLMQKKKIDVMLRTEDALPPPMREEIARKFASGLSHGGLSGSLSFQPKKQGWVTVEPATRGGHVV